ncbi:DMT family transporter [Burkholderia gladioli]|uniref:DMT family transporter n=1 Tax=Burkholderia gladioli TaxID=28095 RepID=UPI003D22F8C3
MLGLFWAATAIFVWSGSLILLRLGVTTGLTAYDLTALRFGVAAALLLPVLLRRGSLTGGLSLGNVLLMVVTFGAPYVLLLSLGVKTASAAAAGALNPGIMAITSVFIARVFYAQRITPSRLLGIVSTISGIMAFVWTEGGFATGHFVLFITGLMWAAFAAFVRVKRVSALHATALTAVGSAVLYLPFYITVLPFGITQAKLTTILLQAVFQGALVTTVAVYAFGRSAELLGSEVATSLPAMIPVVTLALDTFVVGDMPKPHDVAGAFLVTAGIALILLGPRRKIVQGS